MLSWIRDMNKRKNDYTRKSISLKCHLKGIEAIQETLLFDVKSLHFY